MGHLVHALLALAISSGVVAGLRSIAADEIEANRDNVNKIIDYVTKGQGKGRTYQRLVDFTDEFGPRVSGSQALENAINDTLSKLLNEGYDKVYLETVTVPNWVRGEARAEIISPRRRPITILALGSSVGGEVEADVVVVKDFDDLESKARQGLVNGSVVVYNQDWKGYSTTYRAQGATRAAEHGAVAALVRSLTGYSIYTPHTGQQYYGANVVPIPVASITVEDANYMWRAQQRGRRIQINMTLTCENRPDTTSRNVLAEITGSDYPEQIVMFGGHIDSWDVGQGAMDDGGGVMITWQALSTIKALGLKPKRTIRAIFWTAEEEGLIGAEQYFVRHKHEAGNFSLVMESDHGTFTPLGLGFTGSGAARAIIEDILSLTAGLNTVTVDDDGGSPDTDIWISNATVPGANLYNENERYFDFHHTDGDTIDVENSETLDMCTALWASAAFVVANLDKMLPRVGDAPPSSATVVTSPAPPTFCAIVVALALLRRLL